MERSNLGGSYVQELLTMAYTLPERSRTHSMHLISASTTRSDSLAHKHVDFLFFTFNAVVGDQYIHEHRCFVP